MNRILSGSRKLPSLFACLAVLSLCLAPAVAAHAQVSLTQISSDPFTVGPGQHATEVEPHMLANSTTLVAGFQTGRISPGGATAIGWATSTDGGVTWTNGFLPGLTTGFGGGPFNAASDAAVGYDARHNVWMIAGRRWLPSPTFKRTQMPAAFAVAHCLPRRRTVQARFGRCGRIAVSAPSARPMIWSTALPLTACIGPR